MFVSGGFFIVTAMIGNKSAQKKPPFLQELFIQKYSL